MEKYCFGVDVGGTSIKTGLFDEKGQLLLVKSIPTNTSEKGKHIVDDIIKCIEGIRKEKSIDIEDVIGVGAGLPGPVRADGMVLGCVNLGWDDVDVKSEFSEKFYGKKIVLLNDANAATLGEMWKGGGATEGESCQDMVFITLGTGVGGGIVSDGKLICGATGGAGEIGHFPVNVEETEYCSCGKKGCLEQYCSATGVVRMARKKSEDTAKEFTAKDIFDGAKAGDGFCLGIVEDFGKYMGLCCANLASATNPEKIVIGGGVSMAGDIIIEVTKKYFMQYAFKPCRNVEFALATLGNDAGMYGCAYAVMN